MSETFDFVIVGSGGGSMCAALVLRAAGKSVLILEKAALVGGTTATSGGVMWIPNNRFMKQDGVDDSREQAIAYLDAVVGDHPDMPGASAARRSTYVDKAPEMIEFLLQQGIRLRRIPSWPDYYAAPGQSIPGRTVVSELFDLKQLGEWKERLRPGFLPLPANLDEAMQLPLMKRTWGAKKVLARVIGRVLRDKLTGRQRTTAGQALQGQMLLAALNAGVEIRLNHAVSELVVADNRVGGVVCKNGDSSDPLRIDARLGVLINAGGFARNQQMLDQYLPGVSAQWSLVIAEDTGDMIREGQRIGAGVAQMGERIGMQVALPPNTPDQAAAVQNDAAKPHSIIVDQSGQRYANEAGSSIEFSRNMRERDKQSPAIPSWLVFDSRYIDTYMLAGTMPGPKKPKAWFEGKFLHKGDTLEALAAECDIPATQLRDTVERFNGFVRAGRDEDFQRGENAYDQWLGDPLYEQSKALGTIEQGPFYALPLYPGDVSTYGGLVTDENARVLREDGSVIAGLYATGTSTASVMGPVEPGAGGSIGPSFTWGYVAARHALNATGH